MNEKVYGNLSKTIHGGKHAACKQGARSVYRQTIKRGLERGYNPTVFIGMRRDLGTIAAISQLVTNGEIQSGFKRLEKLDLLDFTIEAAVEKFPAEFSKNDQECAAFRLREARK